MDLQDFLDVIDPEVVFGIFVDGEAHYSARGTSDMHLIALHDVEIPPYRVTVDSIEFESSGDLVLLAHYYGRI